MDEVVTTQIVIVLKEEVTFRNPIRPHQDESAQIYPLSDSAQKGFDLDPVDNIVEVVRDVQQHRRATRVPSSVGSAEKDVCSTKRCEDELGKDKLME